MRYGMNPHQQARVVGEPEQLRILNGGASYINYLDALNAWQLVSEAAAATGKPVAASFKHVSPAGVATAGKLDDVANEVWGTSSEDDDTLLSAYVRARDADPKSSFGDVIAVSHPVDAQLADFLKRVVTDAIVAPGYEEGTIETLSAKKKGNFLVLQADPNYQPPEWESREVWGVLLEEQRDSAPITADLIKGEPMDAQTLEDALLGLVTLRYTMSNSICFSRDGVAVGIGAGQQNRVDCVRLAGNKTMTWWLRRHDFVRNLPAVEGMSRQDRVNWQVRFAEGSFTASQIPEFTRLFGEQALADYNDNSWREAWKAQLTGTTMTSDGFLPFRDNVDAASEFGVSTIVEPGGSIRSDDVREACAELGIAHYETGLRLFHH